MANKQKAWRTQAAEINKQRAAGERVATARQQMRERVTIKAYPSWLFMGLMIRAGLYDPLPTVPSTLAARGLPVKTNWFSRAWDKAKAVFA